MSVPENSPNIPDREDRRRAIEALPLVGDVEALGKRTAAAALFDIKQSNPNLHEQITAQAAAVFRRIVGELEDGDYEDGSGNYIIPADVLRGIIARGVITGAAQAAVGIGQTNRHVTELRLITGVQPEIKPIENEGL